MCLRRESSHTATYTYTTPIRTTSPAPFIISVITTIMIAVVGAEDVQTTEEEILHDLQLLAVLKQCKIDHVK